MNYFQDKNGVVHAEEVSLVDVAARYGTPAYVYSAATLRRHARVLKEALIGVDARICYAVKACSNLAVLGLFAREGLGFDIVSGGELGRVLAAGGRGEDVVFSGVGKTVAELEAALAANVMLFNVESAGELEVLAEVARCAGKRAAVSIRVNPDVDAGTHPYVATGLEESKFGVPIAEARALYARARALPSVQVVGVDCHIGSQISSLGPIGDAIDRVLELADALVKEGQAIRIIDLGGGLGVPYDDETPPDPAAYAGLVRSKLAGRPYRVLLEPGRVLVANAGVLLTRVLYVKKSSKKTFVVVDAGMNDLLRPALYGAHHGIEAVSPRAASPVLVDVVGPVCESGDFFAKERMLPPVEPGDLLILRSAGAYGFSMASTYNTRPRPPELLVSGARVQVVRERERIEDLWRGETLLDPSM